MGAPLTSFVEIGSGKIAHVLTGKPDDTLLVAKTSGYGFVCQYANLLSRQKAGKAFLSVEDGASILPPLHIGAEDHVAALSEDARLLVFPLDQVKRLAGGKGVQLMGLRDKEALRAITVLQGESVTVHGVFRNKPKQIESEPRHLSQRARRGAGISGVNQAGFKAVG
jgi:topoisomerase-4 subunit A